MGGRASLLRLPRRPHSPARDADCRRRRVWLLVGSGLSGSAARQLHRGVAAVRAAVATGDRTKALSALSTLARETGRQSRAGHLGAADARALKSAIAQTRSRIQAELKAAPTPPPQASTPLPSVTPSAPAKAQKKAKARGKARGKGRATNEAGPGRHAGCALSLAASPRCGRYVSEMPPPSSAGPQTVSAGECPTALTSPAPRPGSGERSSV
jgi:hypothetical protein